MEKKAENKENKDIKAEVKDGKKEKKEMELTEEDKEYKKNIDDMVAGLYDRDHDIRMNAFNMIKAEISTATTSMTSIPRPLKFLRLHYEALKNYEENFEVKSQNDTQFQFLLRDLLAVLVMVTPNTTDTSLHWVLKGTKQNLTEWGQEFVRNLSGDISNEYLNRLDQEKSYEDLLELVTIIVPYLISQHSDNEAIDLLLEVEKLDSIMDFVNTVNYKRICLYLMASSNYAADTDEMRSILEITYNIYSKFKEHANALRVAIKMNNMLFIKQTFLNCEDYNTQKQLAFLLGKQRIYLVNDNMPADLQSIISNLKLSEYYKKLATELDVMEPKHPEDVIKSHLEEKKGNSTNIDSYKMNMAYSIVSSFVNAGFGTENLLGKKDSDWISRNKDEGMTALIAGLGLVNLWDIDLGPNQLEKYMGTDERDPNKRAGYNIGVGIISSGIRDENNIAFALLTEQLKDKNLSVKTSALFGLGLAYAGSQNDDLNAPLLEVLEDFSFGFEVSAFTSLSFGLTFLGSGNDEVIGNLISILIARNDGGKSKLMESPWLAIYILGMGLTLLGQQKDADLMIEATQLEEFPVEMRMFIKTFLTACAYAGSGNVTKVQELMHLVAKNKEEINPKVQSIAVFGISLIALGEEVGMDMIVRSFNHFLQYGDVSVKKAVPIAMALLNLSNPKVITTDSLIKFCYDSNKDIAINAIFSLGLVSAGTNNSRLAGQLRQLAAYYSEDTNLLLIVRIAQGLLHMGKGLMTLNPVHSHNFLVNNVGIAGVLTALTSFTEAESLICGKHQFLLYSLCLAMTPRMVMLVNENLEPINTQVIVGQAVDIVGQSGNPRTITGFQVHKAPVLIAQGEKCELSTEEFIPYTDVLENVVIVKTNPDYDRTKEKKK